MIEGLKGDLSLVDKTIAVLEKLAIKQGRMKTQTR